jgi:hypothetical protein
MRATAVAGFQVVSALDTPIGDDRLPTGECVGRGEHPDTVRALRVVPPFGHIEHDLVLLVLGNRTAFPR